MATAVAVVVGAAFLTPQAVFACSGPVLTLEKATSTATLIFIGRVVSKPHESAYELEVEETFRGPSSDTVVIGPAVPTGAICSHQLKVGERVVVALPDASDLGLFSSAVWYLLADGSVGSIAPEPPAATHDELFAYLRLLPDTSMIAAATPFPTLGTILLASGLALGILLHVRRGGTVQGI